MVLANEGFDNIDLKYMGGYWVMIEFQSEETKKMFKASVGVGVWFSQLQQASKEFINDRRVTWVEIEGVSLKLWSENTFNRIASKWGTMNCSPNLLPFHNTGHLPYDTPSCARNQKDPIKVSRSAQGQTDTQWDLQDISQGQLQDTRFQSLQRPFKRDLTESNNSFAASSLDVHLDIPFLTNLPYCSRVIYFNSH
ncbi:hypothetical protein Tco_0492297 [Tanacetum coccineum]